MEYYSALKRKEILTQVITGMNLEDITLSKKKPVTKSYVLQSISPFIQPWNDKIQDGDRSLEVARGGEGRAMAMAMKGKQGGSS